MPGRVKRAADRIVRIAQLNSVAVVERLNGLRHILTVTGTHNGNGRRCSHHAVMPANSMVGMPMGDEGAIYRCGRIDVTISGNAIKAVIPWL